MSTEAQNGYMLIFRSTDWYKDLSSEKMQQVLSQWGAWFEQLTSEGKVIAGNPLEHEGKVVSGANKVVSDGPFAESKESIGGYFLLRVPSLEDAVAIAKGCPGLPYGVAVEVRPLADACPMAQKLRVEEHAATLAMA